MSKVRLSWEDFDIAVEAISKHFEQDGITKVVGIARGGLPLAVALSHKMNVPMETLVWQTRDGEAQDKRKVVELMQQDLSKVLFVDEICDSGETICELRSMLQGGIWATWIDKLGTQVDFSHRQMIGDSDWIIFPWE